jgi:hypothetical protein
VGLERQGAASADNSSNKSVTATCPPGKRVVGAGGDVTPGDGDVLIDDIRPKSDLTGVIVSAREDETGTTASWQVNALAICAYPPPGLARLSLTSALDSAKKSVTATCPTGKRLLGAGGEINSSNGQVLLDEVRPNSTLTGAVVNALEDETGNPQNWSLTAYAICANPVAGLQRMSAQSAVDSSISKVKEVSCPAGKQVTGGGGDINSPNGQVVLDALFPDVALTSFGVAAFEDDTENAGNWSLTAYAICANSAERIAAATGPDSGDKTVSAICPAGKGLTGGGGDITGGLGQVVLDDLTPFGTPPTRVEVSADEDEDGTTADWSLRAYAICATPLPGLEQVADSVPFDNSSPKSVTVSCPAGKRVVGAGRDIAGGLGEVVMNSTPNPTLTSVTVSGFEDEDGFAGDWGVAAIAVCASPPPGLQRVAATSEFHSEGEVKTVSARCPAGKNLLGTGAEITGGGGQVVLDDILPNAALTSVLATGVEDQNGFAGDWSVTSYAICANP